MAATKLELEKRLNGKKWHRDSNFYPYIFHSDMTLLTLYNVGQLPKFKMAANETGSGGRRLEFR